MWIGPPGNLVELPSLQPDISVKEDRGTLIHSSVAGGVTVQHMYTDTKRVFSVPWRWLTEDVLADLLAFRQGQYGLGPYVLLTELDTNLLEANQSSGTDSRQTTYGFTPTHGTLSSAAGGYKGTRQLDWALPASPPPSNPSLKLTWKGNVPGIPALPNRNYAFSVYLKSSADIDINLKISFRNTANTVLGEANWQPVPVSSSWVRLDVAGKSPDGTHHAAPLIIPQDSAGSEVISIDHPQLEFGTAATSWKPGLGVPYVAITDVPRGYPLKGWHSPETVKFTEVGF